MISGWRVQCIDYVERKWITLVVVMSTAVLPAA